MIVETFTAGSLVVQVYKSKWRNEYRWRALSGNGRRIANSGEGYKNLDDCLHATDLVFGREPRLNARKARFEQ